MKATGPAVTQDISTIRQRTRFQVAMSLAIIADALQILLLPVFVSRPESI
jgi:hypothetical protein